MSVQSVLVCSQFGQAADGSTTCLNQAWADTYVVTPDEQAQLELVVSGGFDAATFTQFFSATLLLFAVGFTAGIIVSQIRKARRGV